MLCLGYGVKDTKMVIKHQVDCMKSTMLDFSNSLKIQPPGNPQRKLTKT